MQRLRQWRVSGVLDSLATVLVICVSGIMLYSLLKPRPPVVQASRRQAPTGRPAGAEKIPTVDIAVGKAASEGRSSAAIAMVEWADFQCPFCSAFANQLLPSLRSKYVDNGRALFVFRHFPLESIHPFALSAARQSECAGQQDKFWEAHDRFFKGPMSAAPDIADLTSALHLNRPKFDKCISTVDPTLQADAEMGRRLGVSGTPTFFIGRLEGGTVKATLRLVGAQPEAPHFYRRWTKP
jgi:protein-disulfide isomerase